jgi:hypothetical protein
MCHDVIMLGDTCSPKLCHNDIMLGDVNAVGVHSSSVLFNSAIMILCLVMSMQYVFTQAVYYLTLP